MSGTDESRFRAENCDTVSCKDNNLTWEELFINLEAKIEEQLKDAVSQEHCTGRKNLLMQRFKTGQGD